MSVKDAFATPMEGRRLEALVSWLEGAFQEQRNPSSDVPRKQQRPGEEEAVDADVTDLIIQEHFKLSTQLDARVRDFESSTHLHSVPTKRERQGERDAKTQAGAAATWWKSSQTWKEEVHTSGSSTRC